MKEQLTDEIMCGHFLDLAPALPGNYFQTCITSPPYWGLRNYQLAPVVWDGDPDCQHEWGGTGE